MLLAIYLTIFTFVLLYRRFQLSGSFLSRKGADLLEKVSRNKGALTARLGIETATIVHFSITHERWYHGILKALGLATELQTGDSEIDSKLFFTTDIPDHFAQLMQDQSFKDAIRKIFFHTRVRSLRGHGRRLWITTSSMNNDQYNSMYRDEILSHLRMIATHFMRAGTELVYEDNRSFIPPRYTAFLFMAAHAAFFSVALFAGLPAAIETSEVLDLTQWITASAIASGVVLAIWLFLLITFLGGTSWMPLAAADLFIFGLFGIALTSAFVLREVNISHDTQAAKIITTPIIEKSCSLKCSSRSGKSRRTRTYALTQEQCTASNRGATYAEYAQRYHRSCGRNGYFSFRIKVDGWAENNKPYEFKSVEGLFDRVARGTQLNIPVHPGALGIPWVDTDAIVPR